MGQRKDLSEREACVILALLKPGIHSYQSLCNAGRCSKTEAVRAIVRAIHLGAEAGYYSNGWSLYASPKVLTNIHRETNKILCRSGRPV